MEKDDIGFWIFALDDPELHEFYSKRELGREKELKKNGRFYYAIYIKQCHRSFPPDVTQVLHLRDQVILLIEPYLLPIYCRLPLQGYAIIVTEAFSGSEEILALLKLTFSYIEPEGIIDTGAINEAQSRCTELLYNEYCHNYDQWQPSMLRNLSINMMLLSSTIPYELHIRSGHLLNYALQFMELLDNYAFFEKSKAFYAGKIGITEKILTQALWAIYNKTFKEILMGRVLIEAMRMLVFEDKSITQIAHDLDYDASGFNKMFVKWKGMTPKELRVNYRKVVTYVENGY
ncbi:MAG: helix-turn-helix domain-containing protein [Rikenellaceae bacterium]|jgi:AraC-like DNA-binding protein|nr:helix-turn-helix domain-containing protein [Rikenellaceae bacterium]